MKIIAIPTSSDCLCQHFGHCEKFAVFETDDSVIRAERCLTPPPHQPGVLPAWLASQGVTHVIAGGMGHRALSLFQHHHIQVITGAEEKSARILAEEYLNNALRPGINTCDH